MATFTTIEIMAAQTVCGTIQFLFSSIPFGVLTASSVVVGNSIGAKNIEAAKIYMNMTFITSFAWAFISVSLLVLFKDFIISVFSSSEEVNALIQSVFAYFWLNILMDYILRGS